MKTPEPKQDNHSKDIAHTAKEAAPATKPTEAQTEHVVKPGDTLSALAAQYYGDGGEASWQPIYQANREVIGDNPSVIKPGQKLIIPGGAATPPPGAPPPGAPPAT